MKKIAIITGVGPGTGAALVRRFYAGGYTVVMVARDRKRLQEIEKDLPGTLGVCCDVGNQEDFASALVDIEKRVGMPHVAIHNAVGGAFGSFQEIEPTILERNFKINVMALLQLARWVAPGMTLNGGGSILVTGNTSALRGKAKFAGFAPTKAAQRILAESMARELGPKRIHVSYLMIDAVIDVPWTRERYPEAADDFFIKPADIANEAWHVVHQPLSAWSFLTELRPNAEKW